MPEREEPLKPGIVSSIFERVNKKRLSSLFTHKGAKTVLARQGEEATVIRKRLPLGIDIGTNSVKVVQLGYDQDNALRITGLFIEDIPKEAQENPRERNRILSGVLKNLVESNGLKGDCFATIPYMQSKVNLIVLPQMPVNEIDKALRWEVRQITQTDMEQMALDYIVLDTQRSRFLNNQVGALAITARKKDVLEHIGVLHSAGLNPLAIDIEPLADLAVLEYAGKLKPREVILFLDFGGGKTFLNIICDQEFIFARPLNVTGNSLTSAISEYCNVPWQEAEGMKKNYGLLEDKNNQVKNAVLPLLENMVQDIEQSFKYFSYHLTRSQVASFDRVILSGGSSCMNLLMPFLNNRLKVNVEMIDSFSKFSVADMKYKEGQEYLAPRLNVALGLALRGVNQQ